MQAHLSHYAHFHRNIFVKMRPPAKPKGASQLFHIKGNNVFTEQIIV